MKKPINRRRWWLGKRTPFRHRTDESSQKFYHSSAWRKVRKLYIEANPLCVECLKDDKYTQADVVDHKKRFRNYPELGLDMKNLQSLCHWHHNSKSGSESRGGGAKM
tara:strand:+ start:2975 stop:3295 length:321 start_codon:yes stop_codon:yes gene_type:complete